ncbi:MAG: DnaJ domain-containing protein [Thermoproteota archaeon]|jgi:molecular chaperone DnaJ|nr:DnaJ domain-containing protein [Candidatus Nitrosotenuis sp.]
MSKAAFALIFVFTVSVLAIHAQQPAIIIEAQRGSEEISEYYNPNDVRLAMIIIAAAVVALFLYLARDIILRKKTEYEKKEFASKQNRDYEKYHSEWNADDEDFFGEKKQTKEAQEFRKMLQESRLPNYYATLGVSNDATQEEIKAKFRQLAKEYHPDKTKNQKTSEIFAEITKAYEILSDEEKRKTYDKYFKASVG